MRDKHETTGTAAAASGRDADAVTRPPLDTSSPPDPSPPAPGAPPKAPARGRAIEGALPGDVPAAPDRSWASADGGADAGPGQAGVQARSGVRRRSSRRRRYSLRRRLHDLRKTLRRSRLARWSVFGAAIVAMFVAISIRNDVSLQRDGTASSGAALRAASQTAPVDAPPAPAEELANPGTTEPTDLAAGSESAGAPDDPPSGTTARDPVATAPEPPSAALASGTANGAPETLDAVLSAATRVREPIIYVVNEGGSWWRTARRVIDDPVLIDKLLDNLSASGMETGNVAPGTELLAERRAPGDDHRLRIDVPSGTYVSRVGDDAVVTWAYRSASVTIESAFASDAVEAGVPRGVVDELVRANASSPFGLEAAAPGVEYDILFRAERDFDAARTTMHAVALAENGRVLWTEPRLSGEPRPE